MRRTWATAIGAGVLAAMALVAWQVLQQDGRRRQSPLPDVEAPGVAAPSLQPQSPTAPPLPPPAPRTDERAVAGIVLAPNGRAAAGVTVTLHRLLSPWPEWQRETIATVTTGADGVFRFREPRARDQVVSFEHPRFAGDLVDAPELQPRLVLQLQPGYELNGTVVTDTDQPVAGAKVILEPIAAHSRRSDFRFTNASGVFRFTNVAAGTVRLIARHDLWAPTTIQGLVVGVDRSPELRFATPAAEIRGTVVAASTQQPVAGATVLASWPAGRLGLIEPAVAITAADGSFRLPGLGRGSQWLEIRHPDWAKATAVVAVSANTVAQTWELHPRTQLAGRLVPGPGMTWPDTPVTLRLRSKAEELASCTVAADGSFAFPEALTPRNADLEIVDAPLAFARTSAAVINIVLEEAERTTLTLEVAAPATIRGRIVTQNGTGIAGASLFAPRLRQVDRALRSLDVLKMNELLQSADQEPERLLATTADDGSFAISGERPGRLNLRVVCPAFGTRVVDWTVPANGTATMADLVLAPGARITGPVMQGQRLLAGAQVTLSGNGIQTTTIADAVGRFEFGDLEPGDYKLRARVGTTQSPERPVTVRAGQRQIAQLQLVADRLLAGTVLSADGLPVEGAIVMVRGMPGLGALSDAAGSFALGVPLRGLELEVVVGERSRRRIVPIDAVQTKVTIQVDLPPSCTISVRVARLPDRTHPPGGLLRVERIDDVDAEPYVRWVDIQNGRLRHPWFPAGRHRMTLWCEGQAPWTEVLDDLAAGTEHPLPEILLEPGCFMHGRVVDGNGNAVTGAEVFLGDETDLDLFTPQLRSGPDGAFTVHGIASNAATLTVRAAGFATATVPLRLPHDILTRTPKTVRLDPGSTIRVRLGVRTGVGTMVALQRGGRVLATTEAGSDGVAVFNARAAGDYTVVSFGEQSVSMDIRVPGGGQAVEFELQ
ncbi:MAG: carboxypeptidase regulatory-like domain-containing protein [Planctomycetes bacterium]|nr:carboxypeptidase regulatory-like domain-containing protein [Planctomycetota bacterium]